ncbi:MAG: hypothetical protein JWR00_202 [Rubritepida sp.]|nr:hypothetical protein [Rubritepida sp.]
MVVVFGLHLVPGARFGDSMMALFLNTDGDVPMRRPPIWPGIAARL